MTIRAKPQLIHAPNDLRRKVRGRPGALDPDLLAKAEAALASLAGQFSEWLQDELVRLDEARARIKTEGLSERTAEALYLRAHDLKGLGSTYEYPIITRLAASLCRLLDDPETRVGAPLMLVDGHIDAIKASVRDEIRDSDHPVGRVLVTELEARVAAYLASA